MSLNASREVCSSEIVASSSICDVILLSSFRALDWLAIARWRPFVYHLSAALTELNARRCVAFRTLSLAAAERVRFLEGTRSAHGQVRLGPEEALLWPAFTAASTDPATALPSSSGTEEGGGFVFKVHAQRARPVAEFAHHTFKADLLLHARTTVRVKAFREPSLYNLRHGTPNAAGDFNCSAGDLAMRQLSLDEAKQRAYVLVELYEEEELPDCLIIRPPDPS